MMDVQVFNFYQNQVRTVMRDGVIWFVAKDVAEALGYGETNNMTRRLDDDEVISDKLAGMNMQSILINESGVYNAVIGSTKPEAKAFKKWITSEVLPSIRKNGGYITNQKQLTPEQIMANALIVAQNIIEEMKKDIEAVQPKVIYYNTFINRDGLTNFRDTAKEIGISETKFISWLTFRAFVYRSGGALKPYADYMNLFKIKDFVKNGHTGNQTLITPEGKIYFEKRLKEEGVI